MQRLHDFWYKLKCRLWHRFNVVVCRSLPPTWCDRDYLLLHAAFQILEDFVAKEQGHFYEDVYTLYADYDGDDVALKAEVEASARERAAEWQTIRELYHWWLGRKKNVTDDYDEDTAMLHKLIDVRGHLWA